jgi:predicted alpha/beta superfamily hydrolase
MKILTKIIVILLLAYPNLMISQSDIVIGKIDSIQSKILDENRKLLIHVPHENTNSLFSKKTYPVIYLLDGDAHFTSVVGLVEHLSANTLIPEMVVVAIPNTNRNRDLSPSKAEPNPPMLPEAMARASGGGKAFLDFIEREVFPYIDKKYPTASYRMFIGHSLGGLLVMDALQARPELFQGYIAIDPSMWWNNNELLNTIKTTNFKEDKYKNKSLYLGIANTLDDGMDTISARQTKGPMVDHLNAIFETRDAFRKLKSDSFYFKSKYYADDTHGSAPLITTYDGLRSLFQFYQFEIAFSDVMEPNSDVVDRMKAHYTKVTEILGYENKPDEAMINGMGYQLLQMDKLDLASQFFEMNIDYYPDSFNVYDSFGDYFLAINNKEEAKKNFERALAIQENPESRRKLDQLNTD